MTKKTAWILVTAGAWTLYVWISRVVILAGQDTSTGFKVVHFALAAVSIGFGVAVGLIGVRALRAPHAD
ncbi:MAG TPA: hypothetical protein VIG64_09950 [Actinomycetota bacterium]|jgi:hypothetical protein